MENVVLRTRNMDVYDILSGCAVVIFCRLRPPLELSR